MQGVLKPFSSWIYTALRFLAGAMLSMHGMQKLFGVLGGQQPETFSQLWIGGVIELVGGLMVALGIYTSWAAFVLSGMMAVAYFQFHFQFDFSGGNFWPLVNRGELAALYAFVFLYIASQGPGRLSLGRPAR